MNDIPSAHHFRTPTASIWRCTHRYSSYAISITGSSHYHCIIHHVNPFLQIPRPVHPQHSQVSLVTGEGAGIGASIIRAYIENGAKKVYIVGRRLEKLQETAHELNRLGLGEVIPVQGNISSRVGVDQLVSYIK